MIRQTDAAGRRDRALGAFYGLALGDGLGMPTQDLSRDRIAADYGAIEGFRDAGPHQLIAAGMPAGTVTDDMMQAILLARLLIDGHGRLAPRAVADGLLDWEARARGSVDLLGPSTTAAVERATPTRSPRSAGPCSVPCSDAAVLFGPVHPGCVHNSCNSAEPRHSAPEFRVSIRPCAADCRSYARGHDERQPIRRMPALPGEWKD